MMDSMADHCKLTNHVENDSKKTIQNARPRRISQAERSAAAPSHVNAPHQPRSAAWSRNR